MRNHVRNASYILVATLGSVVFWASLAEFTADQPAPGLRDGALKNALRKDWNHQSLSYLKARSLIFGKIDGDGKTATAVYTGDKLEFSRQPRPDKGQVEHTWPRNRMPGAANTDLHHLFPVTPEANIARYSFGFGDVMIPWWTRGGSKAGMSRVKKAPVFEVRKQQRGDTARAMFYISTMYDVRIPADEEKVLKAWHKEDPVSASERARNAKIVKVQKSSNPFVTNPKLVNRISDF